jgi:hypothetical protein
MAYRFQARLPGEHLQSLDIIENSMWYTVLVCQNESQRQPRLVPTGNSAVFVDILRCDPAGGVACIN